MGPEEAAALSLNRTAGAPARAAAAGDDGAGAVRGCLVAAGAAGVVVRWA